MSNRKEMVFVPHDWVEGQSYWTVSSGQVRYHQHGAKEGVKSCFSYASIFVTMKFKELRPCV